MSIDMVLHEQASPEADIAAYTNRFEALLELADRLNVHRDVAERLIGDVLLSSLCRRPVGDVDAWLTGALTYAARRLQ
jgi:hypothetical protein